MKLPNFTSSQMYRLMGTDAVFKTYIEEKRMEMRLSRRLEQDKSGSAAMWGNWVQHRVTNVLLDMGAKPTKDVRRKHATIENWTGAEDYLRENHVGEIKCYELKKFCKAYDSAISGFETLKKVCPDIAWQCVSNAILNNKWCAELTLYVPYQKELQVIRDQDEWARILSPEDFDNKEFKYWLGRIGNMHDSELPYLIEGAHYPNLTSFQFEIKDQDRKELTEKVIMAANKLLIA